MERDHKATSAAQTPSELRVGADQAPCLFNGRPEEFQDRGAKEGQLEASSRAGGKAVGATRDLIVLLTVLFLDTAYPR